MLFSTAGQAQVFLVTAALGALLGLAHDLMGLLRPLLRFPRAEAVLEGAFALCAVLFAFAWLLRLNGGELRAYTLLGMGVGWCLYLLSLSRGLAALCRLLRRYLQRIGNKRFFRSLFR